MAINIDEYPQLSTLCWSRITGPVEEMEALSLYESGWRFIETEALTSPERLLIKRLADQYGNGVLNV